jgi:F-type H+-transporting ATPase subunit epsilon
MHLKILLPFGIFAEKSDVLRIVAETSKGSVGFLPQRLDCVASLVPGILVFETQEGGEEFVAVNEGIMIKTGTDVLISVRNAISGKDLGGLRHSVDQEFLRVNEQEQNVHSVLTKLESSFIQRLARFGHD